MVGNKRVKISLIIPTFNSYEKISRSISLGIYDDRVGEIVVCDDASDDFDQLKTIKKLSSKIRLYKNRKNLGGFQNKLRAAKKAKYEWGIILDSDNRVRQDYLNEIYKRYWNKNLLYCPVKGLPKLDYTEYEGEIIDMEFAKVNVINPNFISLLNTGNYFVHIPTYIQVAESEPKAKGHIPCSIAFTYLWLLSGREMLVAKNLIYEHDVTGKGYWKRNAKKFKGIVNDIVKAIKTDERYRF